ncbi:hypothetical protein AO370_0001 [Moraxella catarrhalis]|uniref:Uncharacterized protein n=1 Tax=Moraxella catarrhalis TaxID=480 RepID=A0AB36DRY8_MORCA|nr:hypothetical protein AO370_0001 [Moraxella catarrhalis]
MLTASRPVKVLASLTVKSLPLATTPMLLPSVSLPSAVSPPLIVKVSPSFLATLLPVSPAKVSGDCDRSYKSLTVAADFCLLASVPALPKRVTKSGCPPLVAGLMADLTLVSSLLPALMPSLLRWGRSFLMPPDPSLKPIPSLVMRAVFSMPAPATPLLLTVANLTPSAPTWICSLLLALLTVKPPLFRVLLPMVRPLSWLSPKVTVPSAFLVATVRPFSPLSFRVLTLSSFVSLPTVMVSSSLVASCFLTVKVCRAVPAVPLVSSSLSFSSFLAASNSFLLMAWVSCVASPTLEMA